MRLPFNISDSKLEGARIKLQYSSPELNQNIEISIDGEETTIEALLDAYHRFISALGVPIPENVALAFVEVDDEEDEEDEEETSE